MHVRLQTLKRREDMAGFSYIPYVLAFSCAAYYNLIGAGKFLNGDKLDVYDSPDPPSLFACKGSGHETKGDQSKQVL